MPYSWSEDVLQRIEQAADLYERLVLVVSPGEASLLHDIAHHTGYPHLNVNLELSRRLLPLAERGRPLQVPRLLDDILTEAGSDVVLLDHTEILFDVSLRQDPLRLLQHLSCRRTVAAVWGGLLQDGLLTYAVPGHREYRRYSAKGLLIVSTSP